MNFYKLEITQYDNIDNVITSIYDQKLSLRICFFKKTNHERAFNIFVSHLIKRGIYIVKGETDSVPIFYIGECENFLERIKDKRKHKYHCEWAEEIIYVCLESENSFDNTEIKVLENMLINKIDKFKSENKVKLINTQIDKKIKLSSDTEFRLNCYFQTIIKDIQYIDPFWLDPDYNPIFKVVETDLNLFNTNKVKIYHNFRDGRIIEANFIRDKNSVILKKGSNVSNIEMNEHISLRLKEKLNLVSIINDEKTFNVLSEDLEISSCSTAANIVTGKNENGWKFWNIKDNNKKLDFFRKNQND